MQIKMRKLLAVLAAAATIGGMTVSVYSDDSAAAEETDWVANLDFNTITSIKSQTFSNGAKATLQATDNGWLPSETTELVQDDGVQVLHFQRLGNQLCGFDLNKLGALTGSQVVFSTTLRFAKLENDAFYHVAMINGSSWYYSFAITSDGSIRANYDRKTTSGLTTVSGGETIANITLDQYNTLAMVYDLTNNKQYFYVNGIKTAELNGYKLGANIVNAPSDITRFKIETQASDGDVDVYIKNAQVYNASEPIGAVNAPAFVGAQQSMSVDSYRIRFCATLDSLDYESVGFKIKAEYGEGQTKDFDVKCRYLYTSLTALYDGQTVQVSASEFGAKYIYALSIDGVPTDTGAITYIVTPYAVKDGYVISGNSFSVYHDSSDIGDIQSVE